jgi:hypothetical protein
MEELIRQAEQIKEQLKFLRRHPLAQTDRDRRQVISELQDKLTATILQLQEYMVHNQRRGGKKYKKNIKNTKKYINKRIKQKKKRQTRKK